LFVVGFAIKEYRSGFHDLGFVLSISIAAAVLFIFLAPQKFGRAEPASADESNDLRNFGSKHSSSVESPESGSQEAASAKRRGG
jgi:hypothetical protein